MFGGLRDDWGSSTLICTALWPAAGALIGALGGALTINARILSVFCGYFAGFLVVFCGVAACVDREKAKPGIPKKKFTAPPPRNAPGPTMIPPPKRDHDFQPISMRWHTVAYGQTRNKAQNSQNMRKYLTTICHDMPKIAAYNYYTDFCYFLSIIGR